MYLSLMTEKSRNIFSLDTSLLGITLNLISLYKIKIYYGNALRNENKR